MYTYIGISFTLKGQDFKQIADVLKFIEATASKNGEKAILVHGFMPKDVVIEKGFSTEVVDTISDIFPLQFNCYRGGQPLRMEMAELLHEFGGSVYVIGTVVDGVALEVAEYTKMNVPVNYLTIGEPQPSVQA